LWWFDNLPLLSFIFLRGKCRFCHTAISWQYPFVEVTTGLLFGMWCLVHTQNQVLQWPEIVRDSMITFCLIFVFVYDILYQEILDHTTLVPGVILFVTNLLLGWITWQSMLIGVVVGAGFFLLQYIVSRGRWIGGGDVRLGAFMGVILGWQLVLVALFVSYVGGALVSVALIGFKKQTMHSETPFGTYLAVATLVTMVWGERIASWYLQLLSM
jgi:prepilin signal peptidase PulO-like enzyme (type II secretory pathway)